MQQKTLDGAASSRDSQRRIVIRLSRAVGNDKLILRQFTFLLHRLGAASFFPKMARFAPGPIPIESHHHDHTAIANHVICIL
jgi:hypothetical protein